MAKPGQNPDILTPSQEPAEPDLGKPAGAADPVGRGTFSNSQQRRLSAGRLMVLVRGTDPGTPETESNLGLGDHRRWGPRAASWSESSLVPLTPLPFLPPTTSGGSCLSICRSIPGNLHGYFRVVGYWDAKVGYALKVQNTHRQWEGACLHPLTPAWAPQAPPDPRPVPAPLWASVVLSVQRGPPSSDHL